MGHFLNIAFKVLSEEGTPLSSREITDLGLAKGWLLSNGRTPWQTMKSKLSTNILKEKNNSLFMRTNQGKFALRQWKGTKVDEYVADRFQKALLDEDIVVFPASSLKKYIDGKGFFTTPIENGKRLLNECRSMPRRDAEDDCSVIQLVSTFVIRFESRYLTYKRTKRLPEKRLHGFYSIAFGGHINPDEIPSLFDIFRPESAGVFLVRELEEEVVIPKDQPPTIIYKGLLYDDSRDISRQHLGIVYDVYLKSDEYEIGERGFLMDPRFETIPQIKSRISDFENWSIILLNHEISKG